MHFINMLQNLSSNLKVIYVTLGNRGGVMGVATSQPRFIPVKSPS